MVAVSAKCKLARAMALVATAIIAVNGHLGFPPKVKVSLPFRMAVKALVGFGFGFAVIVFFLLVHYTYRKKDSKAQKVAATVLSFLSGIMMFASVVVWRCGINITSDKNFLQELTEFNFMTYNSFKATSLMFAALSMIAAFFLLACDSKPAKKSDPVTNDNPEGNMETTFPADSDDKPMTTITPAASNGAPSGDQAGTDDSNLIQPRPVHMH